jgi:hypothetical protein
MPLSDAANNVIWSSQNIHVKGTLDGRLSIGSGADVRIESNVVYEKPPNPALPLSDPINDTKDMLGLIANDDVVISKDFHGDVSINAAIFTRTGSFNAEDHNTRPIEGRIKLIGSIAQHDRGAVGTFAGGTLKTGYLKSYRYDTRMDDPAHPNDPMSHPPAFPGWVTPGPLSVTNWWESPRVPFNIDEFQ